VELTKIDVVSLQLSSSLICLVRITIIICGKKIEHELYFFSSKMKHSYVQTSKRLIPNLEIAFSLISSFDGTCVNRVVLKAC
jgi:hypothetical protein